MNPLSIGYSPCPNDTFIFYAMMHGKLAASTLNFAPPLLEDVEVLNDWAVQHKLDVTKLSFHALGHVLDDYCILAAGSALGRGCGPLVVSTGEMKVEDLGHRKVALPGDLTTAAMLFRLRVPDCRSIVSMRFDRIMEAVRSGEVDAGVIIHEGRFTYQQQGLVCLQDLGEWWESTTGFPIPLGCIAAKRSLGTEKIAQIEQAIAASIDWAFDHPDECLPYIRQHSQELAQEVVQDHIGLYVNDFSRNLGAEGMAAVETFLARGRDAGILPSCELPLTVSGA